MTFEENGAKTDYWRNYKWLSGLCSRSNFTWKPFIRKTRRKTLSYSKKMSFLEIHIISRETGVENYHLSDKKHGYLHPTKLERVNLVNRASTFYNWRVTWNNDEDCVGKENAYPDCYSRSGWVGQLQPLIRILVLTYANYIK